MRQPDDDDPSEEPVPDWDTSAADHEWWLDQREESMIAQAEYYEQEAKLDERATRAASASVTFGRDKLTGEPVTVTADDLCSGTYVVGVQGTGKSSLLLNLALQRLEIGDSLIVLDPHDQLIDDIIARMPSAHLDDTCLLDLRDAHDFPFSLNIFRCLQPENDKQRSTTVNRVRRVFERLWPEITQGVHVENALLHVAQTLACNPECTIADVPDWLITQPPEKVLRNIRHPRTFSYWTKELPSLPSRERTNRIQPFLVRLDELLSDPTLERLLCVPRLHLELPPLIEQRKSLFIKLPVADITHGRAAKLTGVVLTDLLHELIFAATPDDPRDAFTLIVDEFHNFATSDFVELFVEGRKYGAKLILAHQYMAQLDKEELKREGITTAANLIAFRTTPADAAELAVTFAGLQQQLQRRPPSRKAAEFLEGHSDEAVHRFGHRRVRPLLDLSRKQEDLGWDTYIDRRARPAVAYLNELLYDAMLHGRAPTQKVSQFIEAFLSLERFEPWTDRDARARILGRRHIELSNELASVLAALIADPILQPLSVASDRKVSTVLSALPKRETFMRASAHVFEMETLPTKEPVSPYDSAFRQQLLIDRTRKELCYNWQELVEPAAKSSASPNEQDPGPQKQAEEPTGQRLQRQPPRIGRRSPPKPRE
ncbi:type IV secretory system conjugative DNA transfer family protein [Kitasatospora sp. NPDC094028]